MSEIVCVHRWGAVASAINANFKHCKGCNEFWMADTDKGFINEPRVVIGRIENE